MLKSKAASTISSSDKMTKAIEYVEKVDKDIINNYGNVLEDKITAKVASVLGAGATGDKAIK